MNGLIKTWLVRIVVALMVVAAAGWLIRIYLEKNKNNGSIVSGNGRIEATEIDVSTRSAGRIKEILVRDGDFVKAG